MQYEDSMQKMKDDDTCTNEDDRQYEEYKDKDFRNDALEADLLRIYWHHVPRVEHH